MGRSIANWTEVNAAGRAAQKGQAHFLLRPRDAIADGFYLLSGDGELKPLSAGLRDGARLLKRYERRTSRWEEIRRSSFRGASENAVHSLTPALMTLDQHLGGRMARVLRIRLMRFKSRYKVIATSKKTVEDGCRSKKWNLRELASRASSELRLSQSLRLSVQSPMRSRR